MPTPELPTIDRGVTPDIRVVPVQVPQTRPDILVHLPQRYTHPDDLFLRAPEKPTGDSHIIKYVEYSGRLRTVFADGKGDRAQVIDALALRMAELEDYTRNRFSDASLDSAVPNVPEIAEEKDEKDSIEQAAQKHEETMKRLGEAITKRAVNLRISLGSREAILQEIANQRKIDSAVMEELGIDDVGEVLARIPIVRWQEAQRKLEAAKRQVEVWEAQDQLNERIEEAKRREKENKRREREAAARKRVSDQLARIEREQASIPGSAPLLH